MSERVVSIDLDDIVGRVVEAVNDGIDRQISFPKTGEEIEVLADLKGSILGRVMAVLSVDEVGEGMLDQIRRVTVTTKRVCFEEMSQEAETRKKLERIAIH